MTTRRLSIALVFLAGCAVGGASSQLVAHVPPARAGAPVTRWEYHCVGAGLDFKPLGEQGWELATAVAKFDSMVTTSETRYCFKRPLP
jgi:hypothetical protein